MDTVAPSNDHAGMAKKPVIPRKKPPRQFRTLYIGEWIRALGMKQREVSDAAALNEGYLSSLIKGDRKNPSGDVLVRIAEAMAIPYGYLYRRPPPREMIAELGDIEPDVLARLGRH